MYSLGGGVCPPPPRKMSNRIGIVLKCMCIAQFANCGSLGKIRPITLIVWVLGRVEKNAKKGVRKMKKKIKWFFKNIFLDKL